MDVLKRLFGKEEPSAFKGQGVRLGSAEAKTTAASRQQEPVHANHIRTAQTGPSSSARAADRSLTDDGASSSGAAAATGLHKLGYSDPGLPLGSSSDGVGGGPHTAAAPALHRVIAEGRVTANSPTGKEFKRISANRAFQEEQRMQQEERSNSNLEDVANRRPACSTTISDPTLKEGQSALAVSERAGFDETGEVFAMQHSLALVLSHAGHAVTLSTLARILQNILAHPFDAKYRQIRLGNPKIQEELVSVNGAVEFLQACGFEFRFSGDEGQQQQQQQGEGAQTEGYAVLPDIAPLGPTETGWQELCRVMQSHAIPLPLAPKPKSKLSGSAAAGRGAADAAATTPGERGSGGRQQVAGSEAMGTAHAPVRRLPVERETQVILPVTPDTEVPDWFFERTGADVKAEYLRLVRGRQQAERLVTRAVREREAAASTSGPAVATASVRVRFPEGVCLQGQFGVWEPLSAIHEWLSSSLRSPATTTYELVDPSRRALPLTGTVREAGLAPSTLLNFRATGASVQDFVRMPCLSDALLRQTHAAAAE